MAAIKNLSDISRKFAEVTPLRSAEYGEGVAKSTKDWANATEAAEPAFEQGMQAAIARKAFGSGVREAGTAKYKKGVQEKGVARFAAGVRIAGPEYEKGFRPYHEKIAGLQLPPRGPRRDPRNLERVAVVANALGQLKESMAG